MFLFVSFARRPKGINESHGWNIMQFPFARNLPSLIDGMYMMCGYLNTFSHLKDFNNLSYSMAKFTLHQPMIVWLVVPTPFEKYKSNWIINFQVGLEIKTCLKPPVMKIVGYFKLLWLKSFHVKIQKPPESRANSTDSWWLTKGWQKLMPKVDPRA